MFRQITMDELKDLALDAYGQIERRTIIGQG